MNENLFINFVLIKITSAEDDATRQERASDIRLMHLIRRYSGSEHKQPRRTPMVFSKLFHTPAVSLLSNNDLKVI